MLLEIIFAFYVYSVMTVFLISCAKLSDPVVLVMTATGLSHTDG